MKKKEIRQAKSVEHLTLILANVLDGVDELIFALSQTDVLPPVVTMLKNEIDINITTEYVETGHFRIRTTDTNAFNTTTYPIDETYVLSEGNVRIVKTSTNYYDIFTTDSHDDPINGILSNTCFFIKKYNSGNIVPTFHVKLYNESDIAAGIAPDCLEGISENGTGLTIAFNDSFSIDGDVDAWNNAFKFYRLEDEEYILTDILITQVLLVQGKPYARSFVFNKPFLADVEYRIVFNDSSAFSSSTHGPVEVPQTYNPSNESAIANYARSASIETIEDEEYLAIVYAIPVTDVEGASNIVFTDTEHTVEGTTTIEDNVVFVKLNGRYPHSYDALVADLTSELFIVTLSGDITDTGIADLPVVNNSEFIAEPILDAEIDENETYNNVLITFDYAVNTISLTELSFILTGYTLDYENARINDRVLSIPIVERVIAGDENPTLIYDSTNGLITLTNYAPPVGSFTITATNNSEATEPAFVSASIETVLEEEYLDIVFNKELESVINPELALIVDGLTLTTDNELSTTHLKIKLNSRVESGAEINDLTYVALQGIIKFVDYTLFRNINDTVAVTNNSTYVVDLIESAVITTNLAETAEVLTLTFAKNVSSEVDIEDYLSITAGLNFATLAILNDTITIELSSRILSTDEQLLNFTEPTAEEGVIFEDDSWLHETVDFEVTNNSTYEEPILGEVKIITDTTEFLSVPFTNKHIASVVTAELAFVLTDSEDIVVPIEEGATFVDDTTLIIPITDRIDSSLTGFKLAFNNANGSVTFTDNGTLPTFTDEDVTNESEYVPE